MNDSSIRAMAAAWADSKYRRAGVSPNVDGKWCQHRDDYLEIAKDLMAGAVSGWIAWNPKFGFAIQTVNENRQVAELNTEQAKDFFGEPLLKEEDGWQVVPVKIIKVGEVV